MFIVCFDVHCNVSFNFLYSISDSSFYFITVSSITYVIISLSCNYPTLICVMFLF